MWLTLSSDIFTGQIIASIIVLTFVAVFLLREWISQNARPGVFEDEELPDGDQVPAPPRRVEARVNELPEQLAQRQVEAIQALEALRAAETQNGIDRDGRRILPHWQFVVNEENPPNDEFEAPPRIPHKRGERGLVVESEIERLRRKAFNRRLQAARVYGARRKAQVGGTLPLVERELDRRDFVRDPIPPFEFTFRAPGDEELRRPASAPQTMQNTPALNHEAIEALFRPPSAQETPPSSVAPALPFSLSSVSLPPPPSYSPPSYPCPPLNDDETIEATPQLPRRPPLPSVTLPSVDSSTQPLSTSSSGGRAAASPLVSPSLATYCAPEEFNSEAGPSLTSYFTGPKQGALGLNTSEGDNADSMAAQDGSSGSSWDVSLSSGLHEATPPFRWKTAARDKYFALALAGRDSGSSAADDGGQLDSDDPSSSGGEEDEPRIPTPPPPREHVFGGVLVIGADDTDEDGEEDEQSEDDDEEEHDLNGEPAPAVARVRIVQPAADGGVDVVFHPQVEPVRLPQEGARLFEIGQAPEEIAQLVENGVPADNQNEAGNQANEPGIPDAAAAALLAGNEDLDGNGEDDMEGALEGCGYDICSAFDNRPWCLGSIHRWEISRTFSGKVPRLCAESCLRACNPLKLDPYRCLQILHLPIKAMRVVTDPVVDSTIFLVTHAILPTTLRIARRQVQTCCTFIVFLVRHLVGATIADKITHTVQSAVSMRLSRIQTLSEDILY
ncbi:ERAD-associated E3 ubiquitin-protein ligase [Salix suchowensis]|nr:ERAD-associated E3 ubiquitin-protein ligase [Salix suchowensis]